MPLVEPDLSIYQQQAIKPIALQTPDQIAASQEALQARRQAAQQAREKALDDAWTRKAVADSVDPTTGLPDYEKASSVLASNGRANAALGLDKLVAANRKEVEAAAKDHVETVLKQHQVGFQLLDSAVDEPSYKAVRPAILGMFESPKDRAQFEAILPEQFPGAERLAQVKQAGLTSEQYYKASQDALKDLTPEKIANVLRIAKTPEQWDEPLMVAQRLGVKGLPFKPGEFAADPQGAVQRASDLLKTPHDAATEAQAAAVLENTKTNQAAIDAREQQRIALEKQGLTYQGMNAQTARMRENRESAAAKAAANPTGPPPAAIAEYVKNVQNGTWQISNVPLKERDAVAAYLNQSGQTTAHMTAADWSMKTQASQMLPMIDKTEQLAKQIDKMGLTGTVGGRWRQIVSGEGLGSLSGLTPEQRAVVGEFASNAGLLITGIARAHGGARAGGSPQMVAELKKYLDAGNKDYDTFRGNLNGARNFMKTYAAMGEPPPKVDAKKDPLGIR